MQTVLDFASNSVHAGPCKNQLSTNCSLLSWWNSSLPWLAVHLQCNYPSLLFLFVLAECVKSVLSKPERNAGGDGANSSSQRYFTYPLSAVLERSSVAQSLMVRDLYTLTWWGCICTLHKYASVGTSPWQRTEFPAATGGRSGSPTGLLPSQAAMLRKAHEEESAWPQFKQQCPKLVKKISPVTIPTRAWVLFCARSFSIVISLSCSLMFSFTLLVL